MWKQQNLKVKGMEEEKEVGKKKSSGKGWRRTSR